ncbi:MAG: bile acid:Na+ symporter, family [Clostridiales bacterium]|jgi:predicted Na+-dependent transporter|nr:bile acid:Na+ symporter, family [Clostridiales bacterium]MDN5283028.1 bile acid:Na+ symporter, family [Candidatus Ozemobacter sp.]
MRNVGERINAFFSNNMIFFMLAAMVIGWRFSDQFGIYRDLVPWMFGYMTLVTAIKTSWKDLKIIFSRPLPLLSILVLQHLLMPFFAKFLGHLGFPNQPALITGFVLAAALPVGITAVIWSGMAKGDVALSLTAATLDTLISPVIVSLVLLAFIGETVEVNYGAIMSGLLKMIVIPSIIGLSIHDLSKGTFHPKFIPYLGPVSSVCLCGVIVVNVATAKTTASNLVNAAPMLLVFTFALVSSGFILGWAISSLFKFSKSIQTACVYSFGIRNTSCGLVIALGHLPIEASIPLLIAMFFQQPLAALSQKLFLYRLTVDELSD